MEQVRAIYQGMASMVEGQPAIVAVVTLSAYVFGRVYSGRSECRIICGWWDFLFLAASSLLVMAVFVRHRIFDTYDDVSDYLLLTSLACFAVSLFHSYRGNPDPMHAIVSALTKSSLMLIIPLLVSLLVLAMGAGQKDGRYRDGTRGNTRTAAVAGAGALMVALLGSLVKSDGRAG